MSISYDYSPILESVKVPPWSCASVRVPDEAECCNTTKQ